jgi:hypothetical protein
MDNKEIGGLIVFIAGLFGFVSVIGVVIFQAYGLLVDGSWHWYTLADLIKAFGQDPMAWIDPHKIWSWVKLGKLVNWAFYSAPAATIAPIVSLIVGSVGYVYLLESS